MGIFSKKPDPKEVKSFGRGKAVSGKAAQAWAEQKAAQQRARQVDARRRAALKAQLKAQKKGK